MSSKAASLTQPKVFPLSVTTALFERCGYYVLGFLLVLYTKSQFNLSDSDAFALYGILNALVFLTPAIGGYLADNVLGIRRTMVLGLLLEGIGLSILAFPYKLPFLFALSLIIVGVGFFKTGPTNLLGRAYHDDDPRIDSGFTLYYMAMNIGSLFSPVVAGYLQVKLGWQASFLFGAAVLFAGLLVYMAMRGRAKPLDIDAGNVKVHAKKAGIIFFGILGAAALCMLLLSYPFAAHISFFLTTAVILLYFAFEISRSPKKEKLEIIACLSLIIIGMIFFIMYFQYFMSITLFIQRCIRHHIFGLTIPTATFLSLNSFWIIILSPLLVWTYSLISRAWGKDLAITTKFPLGLLIVSLCFLVLYFSTRFADANYQVSSLWMVFAIFLFSLGELLISALGVAMITRIAPKRMYGVMMGAWFLIAAALASSISSSVANIADIPDTLTDPHIILGIYSKAFIEIGLIGLVATVIAFAVSPYIKKIASL